MVHSNKFYFRHWQNQIVVKRKYFCQYEIIWFTIFFSNKILSKHFWGDYRQSLIIKLQQSTLSTKVAIFNIQQEQKSASLYWRLILIHFTAYRKPKESWHKYYPGETQPNCRPSHSSVWTGYNLTSIFHATKCSLKPGKQYIKASVGWASLVLANVLCDG